MVCVSVCVCVCRREHIIEGPGVGLVPIHQVGEDDRPAEHHFVHGHREVRRHLQRPTESNAATAVRR